jgi:uncharacterized protein with von Willebrand factor type A (vWA) domain
MVPDLLENSVVRFVHLLRRLGVRIGSGEVIDALAALMLVDLSERETVRIALKATLVKRPGEREVFDKAFDVFFAPPEEREQQQETYGQKKETDRRLLEQAGQELSFRGAPLTLSDSEKRVYANLPEEERQKLQEFIKKTEEGKKVENNFRPILEKVIKGSLAYWRQGSPGRPSPRETPVTGEQEMDALVEAVGAGTVNGSPGILEKDMRSISDKDLLQAKELIRKLARQLSARITRRYRRSKKRRRLDLRRTIRYNMRYGGTLFILRHRSRRRQRPQLLLFCDVSGSMTRYASFVLQFIYGLHSVVGGIESFVFAENLARITSHFRSGEEFSAVMQEMVNRSGEWGRGTNLAEALRVLRQDYAHVLTADAYMIIVSDTKTLALFEAGRELAQLKRKVKDIVWLNTLPLQDWERTQSVGTFRKIVRMYPCNTISDLEKVMRGKIFS